MAKKKTIASKNKLFDLFKRTKDSELKRYLSEVKSVRKKAGDPDYAERRYLNKRKEENENKWPDFKDVRFMYLEAHRLENKKPDEWVKEYISKQKLDPQAVKMLGEFFGYELFTDKINDLPPLGIRGKKNSTVTQKPNTETAKFKWMPSPEFSERDFLKIAYSFYHSGILKMQNDGRLYSFVEEFAKALSFPLKKGWEKNFYRGIGYKNAGFNQFEIFDVLKKAFDEYLSSRKANKKNVR